MYDIFIPGDIAHDTRLNIATKYFYGVVRSISNAGGVCFASNAYFAQAYRGYTGETISDKQVQRYIAALKDSGHIDVVIVDNKRREIRLSTATATKMSTHRDKNVEHIKQFINDKDFISNNNNAYEQALAASDVRRKYPAMYGYYSNSLPALKEALVYILSDYLDLDAINEFKLALDSVPIYDYCYAMEFDKSKVSRIAKNIQKRNVTRIHDYVVNSFRVPDIWRDVSHMRALEQRYRDASV